MYQTPIRQFKIVMAKKRTVRESTREREKERERERKVKSVGQ